MTSSPRIWPHFVYEEGPSAAGFHVGDTLAFAPHSAVSVLVVPLGGRSALCAEVVRDVDAPYYLAHRVIDDPPKVQASARGHPWEAAQAVHAFLTGRVRFVVDGPPLATVKRFGPYLACHCTAAGAAVDDALGYGPGALCSRWVLPASGAREELVVIERADGEIVYRKEPRVVGHSLTSLRAFLPFGQALPPELEARARDDPGALFGFDDPFVRALDADGAAREDALVEECGVLAG